jgi:hypothetical protein
LTVTRANYLPLLLVLLVTGCTNTVTLQPCERLDHKGPGIGLMTTPCFGPCTLHRDQVVVPRAVVIVDEAGVTQCEEVNP